MPDPTFGLQPKQAAQGLASLGRNGDSMLMHVTPNEVQGLQQLAQNMGGSLTINPQSGLPEANIFDIINPIAGVAMTTAGMSPLMAGLTMGGLALATGGNPLTAALGGYSGGSLGQGLNNLGLATETQLATPMAEAVAPTAEATLSGQQAINNLTALGDTGLATSNAITAPMETAPAWGGQAPDFSVATAQQTGVTPPIEAPTDSAVRTGYTSPETQQAQDVINGATNLSGTNTGLPSLQAGTTPAEQMTWSAQHPYQGPTGSNPATWDSIKKGFERATGENGWENMKGASGMGDMKLGMALGLPMIGAIGGALTPDQAYQKAKAEADATGDFTPIAEWRRRYMEGSNYATGGSVSGGNLNQQGVNTQNSIQNPLSGGPGWGGGLTGNGRSGFGFANMSSTTNQAAPVDVKPSTGVQDWRKYYAGTGPRPGGTEISKMRSKYADGGLASLPQGVFDFRRSQLQAQGEGAGLDEGGAVTNNYARGGMSRFLQGPGDGVSDSIPATIEGHQPAALADGEYVIDARTVSELGNGSSKAGAAKLKQMVANVHKARKSAGVGKDSKATKYLPA